jgi:glycosyltransferase involved in cell wall biosynthesis
MTTKPRNKLCIGLVVPHIFMHRDVLPQVIFSPGHLALDLADELTRQNTEVILFTPGPIRTVAHNQTADLSLFEQELAGRGDSYVDLLKKHPFTFITLARQVQSELIAKAFASANDDQIDVVHIYTNEEDTALPFAQFCKKPVVFTHHDPFNFLVNYKSVFPKYKYLNWLSISMAQRKGMPPDTNWVGNIYHGIDPSEWPANLETADNYIAYFGRIIESKGVHLAIEAVKKHNQTAKTPLKLKIAGKHYAGKKDDYWQTMIAPEIGETIEYVGFLKETSEKTAFLGNARALVIPSLFDEPFGLVMAEALACGTPIIGLDSGAIPEVIRPGKTGILVRKVMSDADANRIDETATGAELAKAVAASDTIDRKACRQDFEARFTLEKMASEHLAAYRRITESSGQS